MHVHLGEGESGHRDHDRGSHRHRVLLERTDQVEAPDRDHDLDEHDQEADDVARPLPAVVAELVEDARLADDQVEDDPGVHADPAHREKELCRGRYVGAAATEGAPREHHLVDAGLVPHRGEEPEEGAADEVPDHDHEDRLDQAETEDRAEGAEHPVDRRQVRAHPDPELLKRRRIPVLNRDRLDAVRVEADRLAQLALFLLEDRHGYALLLGVSREIRLAGLCAQNRTSDNPKKAATSALLRGVRRLPPAPGPLPASRPRRRR